MIMKEKIIKELKSEVSDLNISVKYLENQLDRQKQYSRRNCILIHGITETQDEKTDDISLCTINEYLKFELAEKQLDRTHRLVIQNHAIKDQDLLLPNSQVTIPEETFL